MLPKQKPCDKTFMLLRQYVWKKTGKELEGHLKIGQSAIDSDKTKQSNKKKTQQEAQFTFFVRPCVIIERQLLATQLR